MLQIGEIQKSKECRVEWKFEFSSLSKDGNEMYLSPTFSFEGKDFNLGISPNGKISNNSVGYIDLYLSHFIKGPMKVKFSFALKTVSGKKDLERQTISFHRARWHTISRLIPRSDFDKRESEFLISGFLTVVFTVEILNRDAGASGTNMTGSSMVRNHDEYLEDLKQVFEKQENCDVILRVKGREFQAHKVILAARSPVFASIFRNDTKEKETGIVDIEDCDSSIFPDFLCFLYSDGVNGVSQENVFGLFTAADKYDVPVHRQMCLGFMTEMLSIETFCETLTFALQRNETELIHSANEFFIENDREILVSLKWQSFAIENLRQSNELLDKFRASDGNSES